MALDSLIIWYSDKYGKWIYLASNRQLGGVELTTEAEEVQEEEVEEVVEESEEDDAGAEEEENSEEE